MPATQSQEAKTRCLIDAALEGRLTDSQAEELSALGPEVAKLALLLAARRIAEQDARIAELQGQLKRAGPGSPSTPSGQRPVYTKPPAPKRKGQPGARPGHPGHHRPKPTRIDRREDHRLDRCPSCGGALQRCGQTRRRIIEDLLQDLRAEAVEHTIHRDYCPACQKHVEPVVPDALPHADLGHRVVGLTAWLHYGLGLTISQTQELLRYQLQTGLSPGGLSAAWGKMATILTPWYEQIASEARVSAVLHADETGWRVNGITHWLWCFANPTTCYYLIDRSRGTPALEKFFVEAFDGVLVSDFWAPYDHVLTEDRQCCLAHLLRELEKVDLTNSSPSWKAFAQQLRRLVRDGIRLRKRADFTPAKYTSRITRINLRVYALAHGPYADADAQRLAGRLSKHCDQLFTFLDRPEVPYDNNLAERMVRPAVILRKTCQGNRSEQGAAVQAVLMSVYRTLKLRGRDPLHTITSALETYLATGQLPPIPVQSTADG
jgi:transposase